jgi:sec-independent protein translocase protein TatA
MGIHKGMPVRDIIKKKIVMGTMMLLFALGGSEVLLIFFAILLLFGGRKIPELMRGIGKGIREFNAAKSTIESELKEGMREADNKAQQQPSSNIDGPK